MQVTWQADQISALEKGQKVNLINSLPGFKSVNLIGTKSKEGFENLAIFSTVIHLGSNPPLLGFMHRPIRYFGHTLKNILSTGQYTINHITPHFLQKAHLTQDKLPVEESEFDYVGLNTEYVDGFDVPTVSESPLKIGMKLIETHSVVNETVFVVGEVVWVSFDDKFLKEDGTIDLIAQKTIGNFNFENYFEANQIE